MHCAFLRIFGDEWCFIAYTARSMKKIEFLLFMLFIFFSINFESFAVIPENKLSYPVKVLKPKEFARSVTEHEFIFVTKTLEKLFAKSIEERGAVRLVIKADWKDATVNAFATREVETWSVHIPGGIARAPGMTKDSLALIVCHELGHHLGGAPRTFLYEGWPSAEGQADYWATSKCLKKYYKELALDSVTIVPPISEKITHDCTSVYKTLEEQKICIRSAMASIDFGNFLNALPDAKAPVNINTPDTRHVKGTNTNDYPRPQCRLDTLYQGGLCTISSNEATSEVDPIVASCMDYSKLGARPRCWFKP